MGEFIGITIQNLRLYKFASVIHKVAENEKDFIKIPNMPAHCYCFLSSDKTNVSG